MTTTPYSLMMALGNEQLVFKRLGPEVLRKIWAFMIAGELKRLGELDYRLDISEAAVEFLVIKGFHKDRGARLMRDAVEKFIQEMRFIELCFRTKK